MPTFCSEPDRRSNVKCLKWVTIVHLYTVSILGFNGFLWDSPEYDFSQHQPRKNRQKVPRIVRPETKVVNHIIGRGVQEMGLHNNQHEGVPEKAPKGIQYSP